MKVSRYFDRLRRTQQRRDAANTKRSTTDRMPEETAQEYIEHYELHGIEHFKPAHCPAKFRAEVLAHFRRAA